MAAGRRSLSEARARIGLGDRNGGRKSPMRMNDGGGGLRMGVCWTRLASQWGGRDRRRGDMLSQAISFALLVGFVAAEVLQQASSFLEDSAKIRGRQFNG